ncbi:phosphoribosyl pyrophosphokinase [Tilletiaria anomala UBC 951]|uniref:ribose-phosphate diphosphokinase n=1 Tax=Tilletiaria anomala (strain ATCC 24038 / CBS 436.72 / UBC 951) TaxID=1037660 RepID=A0A066VEV1_TILAU|nr:phosphoribosyl pyrophosphokinase [Tilletiaria anomala UBC 951]KDN37120.1 phosphoribosyl pyrophosphokinase [Tilletiaria anomala UBC 951]
MPGAIRLLTGSSHPELANLVAKRLGVPVTNCSCSRFADQSINVQVADSIRDDDTYIVQTGYSTSMDPNDALMELLIIISACKTASARRITAVIPAFPYSRHDKKDKSRAPITAKLVANMITIAGADHVITLDLHASQIQGFFDIPVDNLTSEPSVARWIRSNVHNWRDSIIVSPDAGGAKRATALADALGVDFALINRNRKREANRRARAARLAKHPGALSTRSSFSDLRSHPQTPLSGSIVVDPQMAPQQPGRGEPSSGVNSNQQIPLPSAMNDSLQALSMGDGNSSGASPPAVVKKQQFFDVANGVQANENGEWVMTDAEGYRVTSGSKSRPLDSATNDNAESGVSETEDERETKMEILVGDVAGRIAILIDDMIDTGKTLALAVKTLKDAGASEVYAIVAHGLLSGKATDLIKRLDVEKLVVTNTIPNSEKIAATENKLEIMDVSAVLAESIRRSHNGESISLLFREDAAALY